MNARTDPSQPWALLLKLIALIAGASLAECSSNALESPGRVRFETEHIRYWAVDGNEPCELTAYWLERFHNSVTRYLGLSAAHTDKIDYYWVSEDDIIRICRADLSGCAFGHQVYSVFPQFRHELVHAIVHDSGIPPDFVAEGLAEMLGCTHGDVGDALDKTDVLPLLTSDFSALPRGTTSHARALARSFVRFLIETYGTRAFLRFYGSMPADTDLGNFDRRCRESFATPLNEMIAQWQAIPERSDEACLFLTECEDAPSIGEITVQTGCGQLSAPETPSTTRSFSVDDGGLVRLEADQADPLGSQAMLSVHRCQGGNAGLIRLGVPQLRLLRMPPGRYFVSVVTAELAASVALRITSERPPEVGSCLLSADPLPLLKGRPVIVTRRWAPPACVGQPWCPGESVDLAVASSGFFFAGRASASIPTQELPEMLYQCDTACPVDAAKSCATDWLVSAAVNGSLPRLIRQRPVLGEILHVATGPAAISEAPYVIQYALLDD